MIKSSFVREFNIITYNAISFLKHYDVKKIEDEKAHISYEINYDDPRELRRFIKSTDSYKDTAMFYQIRKIMEKRGVSEWNEDSLKKVMIFVDFENIFTKLGESNPRELGDTYTEEDLSPNSKVISNEYRLRVMFNNGINIRYKNGEVIKYVPFDKSNSMSRQSKMSFIDESFMEELNVRHNVGISFDGQTVSLSKYYAYRGLYLSNADRVNITEKEFNSETVIIIPDGMVPLKPQNIITADEDGENSRKWKMVEKCKELSLKPFDGEGIISPKYAALINERCGFDGATSFQIRMPFVKGMLHQVDFHRFINEVAGECESFTIKDYFGVDRDLMKAEIIMPESMFKCVKWIKDEMEHQGLKKAVAMDYYFEKFYEYDHAMYISNTDLIYGKSSITRLNYQFLNTLALSADEFASLVSEHMDYAMDPVKYLYDMGEIPQSGNDENKEETSEEEECGIEKWKFALDVNPALSHEPKINSILSSLSEGLKTDCARGKILVKGEIRYLSRDLLRFLIELVRNGLDEEQIKGIEQQCLFEDRFYMPESLLNLEITRHYPIFRNPHLSRNEQCVLKPYIKGKEKAKKDLYYKYFSHLKGVIMVSYFSTVPQALGGADFDGDIVKIIDDARVRNAVLRGTYDNYKRKLPIIDIPSAGGHNNNPVTGRIMFEIIKDTFANQIGQISNLSIRIGSKEYGTNEELEHSCVECTILTGLEIDAAKTGVHPDLTEILKYGETLKKDGFDYVSDFKEKVDILKKERVRLYRDESTKDSVTQYKFKKHKYDEKSYIEYECNDSYRNLDKLPMYFFTALEEKMRLPGEKQDGRYRYFDFLKDNAWKKMIDTELQNKLGAIITAYYRIEKIASKLFKYRNHLEKGNYEGYIRTVLQMQYDYEDYEEIAREELEKIFAYVDSQFETKESIEKAIDKLKTSNWAFLLPQNKRKVLSEIINYNNENDIEKLLTNFEAQGYNLLFYILKDVMLLKEKAKSDEEIMSQIKDNVEQEQEEEKKKEGYKEPKKVDMEYFREFYALMYEKYAKWRDEKYADWKKRLFEACNSEFMCLLENVADEDLKFMLLYSLRGAASPDKMSLFFWKNVSLESLKKHCVVED